MASSSTHQVAEPGSIETAPAPESHEDLIYDVGLNSGDDTAFYLALGYRVIALESDPESVERCRNRFAAEIAQGRLTIIDETIDFAVLLQSHGAPHFIKLDLGEQGRRFIDVLGGFTARPRFVSIPTDVRSWDALEQQFNLLEGLGYGRFAVVKHDRVPGRLIRTTDRFGNPLEYRLGADARGAFGGDLASWSSRGRALDRYRKAIASSRRRRRFGRAALDRIPGFSGISRPAGYDTHAMYMG